MNSKQGNVKASGTSNRLVAELKSMGWMMLYFACWLVPLLVIKNLLLEDYQVPLTRLSAAVVGALVLSKAVLILEHVPLGGLTRNRPAWLEVLLRTTLYAAGVAVVLLLEKGFEGRHEYGGFWPSLLAVPKHADIHHVWINLICVSAALLSFNVLDVIRRHLDLESLLPLFGRPVPGKD
jgi:hypothetical protein